MKLKKIEDKYLPKMTSTNCFAYLEIIFPQSELLDFTDQRFDLKKHK